MPAAVIDARGPSFYASSAIRGWGAISLKDIGNYKLLQVHEALQRVERAVCGLEKAADAIAPALPVAREAPQLKSRLEELTASHAALKANASQVATRLDDAIARLARLLGDDTPQP